MGIGIWGQGKGYLIIIISERGSQRPTKRKRGPPNRWSAGMKNIENIPFGFKNQARPVINLNAQISRIHLNRKRVPSRRKEDPSVSFRFVSMLSSKLTASIQSRGTRLTDRGCPPSPTPTPPSPFLRDFLGTAPRQTGARLLKADNPSTRHTDGKLCLESPRPPTDDAQEQEGRY